MTRRTTPAEQGEAAARRENALADGDFLVPVELNNAQVQDLILLLDCQAEVCLPEQAELEAELRATATVLRDALIAVQPSPDSRAGVATPETKEPKP